MCEELPVGAQRVRNSDRLSPAGSMEMPARLRGGRALSRARSTFRRGWLEGDIDFLGGGVNPDIFVVVAIVDLLEAGHEITENWIEKGD